MSVTMDARGPLFDGRLERAITEARETSEKRVAILGASMVRTRLNNTLKTQTPYYRMRVTPVPDLPNWKITDQGVIYGPWLEGIGSRNYPVTRFRGYHVFRIVSRELQARATVIADSVVVQYLGRL